MGIAETRRLLDLHGLHLSRDLGQNFLVDDQQADRLARLAGVEAGDSVLEVGTGFGVLTRALARRAARVTTIEIDSGVVRALEQESLLPENVTLMHADALEVDLAEAVAAHPKPVRLVANLPYSAATPLLRRLLDLRDELADWSVMIQKEVADRIISGPGTKAYGSFSVLHRLTVDVHCEAVLPPAAFFPAPKVDSSFIRVWPRSASLLAPGELLQVERVVRAAFAQRRKTLTNSLRGGGFVERTERAALDEVIAAAEIPADQRAERVAPETFLTLTRLMVERGMLT
jgi:16S rRNA (adenine1518-N6/adenine1519-N6)-dimethyltransferase